MSKAFLEFCAEKLALSPEFEAGFDAGFRYANSVRPKSSRTCACSQYYTCAEHKTVNEQAAELVAQQDER